MEFVINEWLPEYFKPEASFEEKKKLEQFLNKFIAQQDKIYVRRPSPFLSKIKQLAKAYQNNVKIYGELKKFHSTVLRDSNKCQFINDGEFELSEAIRDKLIEGGNTVSDTYLFEAASATKSKLIITTDTKLKKLMEDEGTFKIKLLDDFLTNY